MFGKKKSPQTETNDRHPDFAYLPSPTYYFDTACQSLRPKPVIDSINSYYETYNACGGRVKYAWGKKVDEEVEIARQKVLHFLKLSSKDYVVSFTLNTTYALNLILTQLQPKKFKKIITSDIEHNSVFLSTISTAERLQLPRYVLERSDDGSLNYSPTDLEEAIVVINATSNIDGRLLKNINDLITDAHNKGGVVIIDAAQTTAHYSQLLHETQADAICFSSHKMYGPSLGCLVYRKSLLDSLALGFIGGGMVSAVKENSYTLLPDDLATRFEPGLQDWAGIIGLSYAIDWISNFSFNGHNASEYITFLSEKLHKELSSIEGLQLLNSHPTSVTSVYHPKHDAHLLAKFLSEAHVMVRSGYFCCHYYLLEKKKLPPMLRFSIGLHTTESDIEAVGMYLRRFIGVK